MYEIYIKQLWCETQNWYSQQKKKYCSSTEFFQRGKKNYTQRHAKAIEIRTEISKWFQKELYQVLGLCSITRACVHYHTPGKLSCPEWHR